MTFEIAFCLVIWLLAIGYLTYNFSSKKETSKQKEQTLESNPLFLTGMEIIELGVVKGKQLAVHSSYIQAALLLSLFT